MTAGLSGVSNEALKEAVCRAVDAHREEIVELAEAIRVAPELGFKERHTSALVAERFRALGIPHEQGLALTGVKGRLRGGASGATSSGNVGGATGADTNGRRPTVAVMGELDAYLCREHPDALAETGAVHA